MLLRTNRLLAAGDPTVPVKPPLSKRTSSAVSWIGPLVLYLEVKEVVTPCCHFRALETNEFIIFLQKV